MKTGFKNISVKDTAKAYLTDESGATAIEYGLLAALIAVAAIGGMNALGNENSGSWKVMSDKIVAAGP